MGFVGWTRAVAPLGAAVGLALASPASAAQLDKAERAMVASVARDQDRAIKLLETLVNVNSGSLNLPGVEQNGKMVAAELEPLGFKVRWIPMTHTGRAGHLVAEHHGRGGGKRMLLIAHLDTVFEPHSPFQTFTRRGDVAEGPGVGDIKGGVVIIVTALRAMKAAGVLDAADITIVLTGDEEKPGEPLAAARADLIAAGKASDVALDFEGLSRIDGKDVGSIARRSSTSWTLKTTGKSGHSSGIFSDYAGYGAIYEQARILDGFRRELPEPNLTYSVGLVLGGASADVNAGETGGAATGKSNVVAAVAVAQGDIRTLSEAQSARVRDRMQSIVAAHLPGTGAELTFADDGYPAMAPTAGNRALLAKLNAVNQALGLEVMAEGDPARRGAGDISFVAADTDGLVGLGAAGEGSHAPGETVDLKSLDIQARRAALLMYRLSREPRGK
jgi:glutamate carboxypeptidase